MHVNKVEPLVDILLIGLAEKREFLLFFQIMKLVTQAKQAKNISPIWRETGS